MNQRCFVIYEKTYKEAAGKKGNDNEKGIGDGAKMLGWLNGLLNTFAFPCKGNANVYVNKTKKKERKKKQVMSQGFMLNFNSLVFKKESMNFFFNAMYVPANLPQLQVSILLAV